MGKETSPAKPISKETVRGLDGRITTRLIIHDGEDPRWPRVAIEELEAIKNSPKDQGNEEKPA